MKKVLIGVGIGCGVIILVCFGLLLAGGMWVKDKFGGTIEAAQKMQVQEEALAQLNQSHPFQPPPRGEVLALDAKRLDTYLSVREGALPVFKAFEQKTKEFEEKYGGDEEKKNADIGAAMEAANLMMGLVADVRAAYIDNLKKHGMSPAEFQTITSTVYASMVADSMAQVQDAMAESRKELEKQLDELEEKLASDTLSEEERTQLEEAQGQLQVTLASLDEGTGQGGQGELSAESKKVAAANVELLKKYEERVTVMANTAFDGFVMGDAGANLGDASAQDLE